jgi:hypothetical protein
MRYFPVLLLCLLIGSGCAISPSPTPDQPMEEIDPVAVINEMPDLASFVWPMDNFKERVTFKRFGQEVRDRFSGFHSGDDGEVIPDELTKEVPVYATADGQVIYRNWVSGYGGVMVLEHEIEGERLNSLYGHIDLAQTPVTLGDFVRAGTIIAYLGDDKSRETDGERKHLHFGLYRGNTLQLNGYVPNRNQLTSWINPLEYLDGKMAAQPPQTLTAPENWQTMDLSSVDDSFRFQLSFPLSWRGLYVPEADAIAIYDPALPGETDLEKSVLFLRYFDADSFQTLSTVTIHERFLRDINRHKAVDYVIEKKAWATDFFGQPAWRNTLHTVTDIRAQDGQSRFYVIGQRPDTDKKLLEYVLHSFEIVEVE